MRVSLNTIRQFTPVELSVSELVQKTNEQLGSVEEVIDLTARYENTIIVRVVECSAHSNADTLSVCLVDDAGVVDGVARNDDGLVQIVCGAPNVRAGMLAVWLPPDTTVPVTHGTDVPFVLGVRELRGVVSNGMLAAADELGIGDDHEGIVEIDDSEWTPYDVKPAPGVSFAIAYGLNDTIIDIENKMFTHRPDCFGQLGVAREIAGITQLAFESPRWYKELPAQNPGETLPLTVTNESTQMAPRFMAVAVKDVTVDKSPLWMQCELMRLGIKAINNVVDITNYVMLLTGQPTHAYDYDKLHGHAIGARMAVQEEKLTLLNGKTYSLTTDDIVIADAEGAVGLAGIMGGGNSEVGLDTTKLVLEVANFDMYAVRKTSMRHGLFTDALTRFNKGQSSLQQPYILSLLLTLLHDVAGAKQAGEVFDVSADNTIHEPIRTTVEFIVSRLGINLAANDIVRLLHNVEIDTTIDDDNEGSITITPPFWRTDLLIPEDVIEEVGRLYGFDKLSRELPMRRAAPAPRNTQRELKQTIRSSLKNSGANEVMTYSFVHKNTIMRAGQDISRAFTIGNALSPDLQHYRLNVLPSLLDKVHANVKSGYDEFVLFEIGKGHDKTHPKDGDGLPYEYNFVDAVYASKNPRDGAAYYYMRRLVTQLAKDLGFTLVFKPLDGDVDASVVAPFDTQRSSRVESRQGEYLGIIGELRQSVRDSFKLPQYTAALTLSIEGLQLANKLPRTTYSPLSKYPSISQDISLRTAHEVSYEDIFRTVWTSTNELTNGLDIRISPVAIYKPSGKNDKKTTTLHLEFISYDRTLSDSDISPVVDGVCDVATTKLGAERI
ncbi:phenylalanine--tRNA ligase subunit beta [Candidatus Saccharibacteria bacterium]|nr:phenylalanine--tRNA ligase subunit beta [Candidatus Saccharibacteria bacterium]